MQNIGGYNFVYSTVLLYPFVILAFKMKKLHFSFVLLFTGLIWFMVIQAEYTIAVMLLLLSSLLFFVRKDITIVEFFKMLVIFFVLVLIFRVMIAAVLTHFAEMIGNQGMVDKINVLFLGKDAVNNFDDDRSALYMLSLEKFLKSPLIGMIGSNSRVTGGHSFILDNLALYGLIGGGLMAAMYSGIFATFYRPLKDRPCYAIAVWAFLQPIVLSTINTGMWLNNLTMFAPVLLCAIYGEETYIGVTKPKPKPLIPVKTL
jgi:O-antigen ligase